MREKNYCGLCDYVTDELDNGGCHYLYCPIIEKPVSYAGKTCQHFTERDIVKIEDIIGVVKAKHPTDSVMLKKKLYHPDRFKYEKPRVGFAKGEIYDTETDEHYEETTNEMLDLLNYINFEKENTKSILQDFMELIDKIQNIIQPMTCLEDLNKEEYNELLKLCNVGREMLYMQDYTQKD